MTAADDHLLMEQADGAFAEGRLPEALRLYTALLEVDVCNLYAWYRCAALLARLGAPQAAAESLDLLAERLADEGSLLLALAAAKELGSVDGARGVRRVEAIAVAYGAGSSRVDPRRRGAPPRVPERRAASAAQRSVTQDVRVLRESARDACAAAEQASRSAPRTLATVPYQPLLCELEARDLAALVALMELRAFAAGAQVIEQGTEGRSFFVIVRGAVGVRQRTADGAELLLAHLRAGSFFGEMALLTDSPRVASVTCDRPTIVFELERAGLEELAGRSPQLAAVLAGYTRDRLLRNLLATSPLFTPLAPERREKLVELFETSLFGPGEVVLAEGQASEGLFVVLSGAVRVTRADCGEQLALAELGPGQIFGEISLFQRRPATATVRTARKTVLLGLSRAAFNRNVADFPEVVAHVYRVAVERESANLALERSQLVAVEESLLLI
jgi:CRP-like cAMP-binding protein